MKNAFNNPEVKKHFLEGGFGLEKEGLRINPEGYLSHTPHPFGDDPHYDRDFCENQVELVTDVYTSVDGVWNALAGMQQIVARTLDRLPTGREIMWPFSNPPYVKWEDDVPIAQFSGQKREKTEYREYLSKKYGRKKMLYSGIHFNYSMSENFLKPLYEQCNKEESYREFKDRLYLRLTKKVVEYDWLIVYLTAASSVMDGSFYSLERKDEDITQIYSSARCSEIGYWNAFVPVLSYESLDAYIDSIESYVKRGELCRPAELYYPVRLKPKGENSLYNLRKKGVDHIELRMLDLNPLTPVGMMKEDIFFLQLMLLYLIFEEEGRFEYLEQLLAIKNAKAAALFKDTKICIDTRCRHASPIHDAARDFIQDMKDFYRMVGLDDEKVMDCIEYQWIKILRPEERYAAKVHRQFGHNYVKRGLRLAEEYARKLLDGDI